jgi:hypothetical protein
LCQKSTLEWLEKKARPGVGGYCRLPDDDPWQDRNTNYYSVTFIVGKETFDSCINLQRQKTTYRNPFLNLMVELS